MKKHTAYYIIGGVLVATGIYLYSKKSQQSTVINLAPPQTVDDSTTTAPATEPVYITALDKIKEIIEVIKAPKKTA